MKKQPRIEIGVEEAKAGYERFVDAWNGTASGGNADVHLNFEDLETLVAVLTPKRLELMRTLRRQGPMSIRALSRTIGRHYKNVHVDTTALIDIGLVQRTEDDQVVIPWDVIDAHLRLVA